ncbi:hypothetical protein [Microbulbifer sp. ALW1]|uniref:hypothetical protein n=1 Tax=Microbulbifer sp. (strain ALW1) TaxID=1516059 RepID=UPI001359BAEF|nr:hypothetical protein [Microbulbifer sp. ALW1]
MGDSNRIEALEAQLRQRDHEIRDLKAELAHVNSVAHYRLQLIRAQSAICTGLAAITNKARRES